MESYARCLNKQAFVKEYFTSCKNKEDLYKKIIELGRESIGLEEDYCIPENLVSGCQSSMYLRAYWDEAKNNVLFRATSDALISAGLAEVLLRVYSDEPPEVILKCEPLYLKALNLESALSPSRSNGLGSIYLRMKQEALKLLMQKATS